MDGVGSVGGKRRLNEGACEGGLSSCFWAGGSHKENTITPICNVDLCNVDRIMSCGLTVRHICV